VIKVINHTYRSRDSKYGRETKSLQDFLNDLGDSVRVISVMKTGYSSHSCFVEIHNYEIVIEEKTPVV